MQVQKLKPGYKLVKSLFGKYEEIPEEWKLTRLDEIVTNPISYGVLVPDSDPNGVPMIRSGEIDEPGGIERNLLLISPKLEKKYQKTRLVGNEILFALVGATIGQLTVVSKKYKGYNVSRALAVIRFKKYYDPGYFANFFRLDITQKKIKVVSTGSAQPVINLQELSKFKLVVPPLEEQQKISSILSNVDSLIQKTDKIIEHTKVLKKGMMQQLLTKGIGHTKFKKVTLFPRYKNETIPEKWNLGKLGNLVKIIDYRGRTPPFSDKGIPHLRSNNIRDGKINLTDLAYVSQKTYDEYMIRGLPQENDVLFTTEGPLGEVALVPKNFKFSLAQRIMILRPKNDKLNPKFLKCLLLDRKIKIRYEGLATGTTLGGIASKWFTKIMLPYPESHEEQKTIAESFEKLENRLSFYEQKKSILEYLIKGLMQKLLTGQIRVNTH